MDVEEAIALADDLILAKTGKPMNDLQRHLFRGSWQGKSFTEIHQECADRCGLDHLMRNVGPELWKLLSEVLGTKVSKNQLQGPLERSRQQLTPNPTTRPLVEPLAAAPDIPPDATLPFYIERFPYEVECLEAITRPGALIRIRAPQEMGKTWLMERILSHARAQAYRTQAFSFELSDSTVYTDLNKFSRWFCASVGQALGLANKLQDYWEDIFGCNYNSTLYFENYLLPAIHQPLVLALDKVDLVFEHPAIANDFCSLLRGWNQRATQGDETGNLWKKLRLMIVHSTEVYGALNINHSPLAGVGLVIKLPEFSFQQVQQLTQLRQLSWQRSEIDQLMALVGGHPYLIQCAIEAIARQKLTLPDLLATAATEAGAYSDHLRRHLWYLQQQPELAIAFKQVIAADQPVQLNSMQAFKLESMGLVQLQGNQATPRCDLYRLYFQERL